MARVTGVPDRPFDTATLTAIRLPDRRHRIAPTAEQRIGVFDFLALQGCPLGELAGARSSPLGRQLDPARRLVHELAVEDGAAACLEAGMDRDRRARILEIVDQKRADRPAYVWNAVWTGREAEAFLSLAASPFASGSADGARAALASLVAAVAVSPRRARDGRRIEQSLEALRAAAPLGPVLRDMVRTEHTLSFTAEILRGVADPTRCDGTNRKLVAAFRETWLAFVQAPVGVVFARGRDELPLADELFRATYAAIEAERGEALARMAAWHAASLDTSAPDGLWPRFAAALEAHVAAWRPVLEACGVLDRTDRPLGKEMSNIYLDIILTGLLDGVLSRPGRPAPHPMPSALVPRSLLPSPSPVRSQETSTMSAALDRLADPSPLAPARRALTALPDIARSEAAAAPGRIDRVGMEKIELPIRLRDRNGEVVRVPAEADVFVSLDDPEAKGIHMSRLFLALQEILGKQELVPDTLRDLLETFVVSHDDTSEGSALALRFSHLRESLALSSEHFGWKSYPIDVRATLSPGALRVTLGIVVPYSSTCPCSAALSREVARDHFLARFGPDSPLDRRAVAEWLASPAGMPATPHSQRSFAHVDVALSPTLDVLPIDLLIDRVESSVGTPVQSAVKREDEQAFAELNGSNLMFCEDASRRIRRGLEGAGWLDDYRIRVQHEESLHPHDAVAVLCKGVEGGFRA